MEERPLMASLPDAAAGVDALGSLSRFRVEFYDCLYARANALFELTDAVLCKAGSVQALVDLSLEAEHRRGHGALYQALNTGWAEPARLRGLPASLPVPRAVVGRIVLAVDVSTWLRPDAEISPGRLFCHVYGRGRSKDQFIPGRPYSFVAVRSRAAPPGAACRTQPGSARLMTPLPSPLPNCATSSSGSPPQVTGARAPPSC